MLEINGVLWSGGVRVGKPASLVSRESWRPVVESVVVTILFLVGLALCLAV